MLTAIFFVSNVHCPSCVSFIQDTLHGLPGVQTPVDVSLIEHTVRVNHDESISNGVVLLTALQDAAFEVEHVTELDEHNAPTQSYSPGQRLPPPIRSRWSSLWRRAKQEHIDNCVACQRERSRRSLTGKTWRKAWLMASLRHHRLTKSASTGSDSFTADDVEHAGDTDIADLDGARSEPDESGIFHATLSVEGMTCSACTSAIAKGLLTSLTIVDGVDVSLPNNSAQVRYHGRKQDISIIMEAIEDLGYEANVVENKLQHKEKQALYQAKLSIEGMTCGSCAGSIRRGLDELPSILSCHVDLVGNSAVVTFRNKDDVNEVLAKIDDLGYSAEVAELTNVREQILPVVERTVRLTVDGMYCHHCPEKVAEALNLLGQEFPVHISAGFSLAEPVLQLTYKPSIEHGITLRRFTEVINQVDPALSASIYQPPSLEERSRQIQRRERNLILLRLLFTGVVAIPTFIIGIVFMSLVSSDNHTRQWFERPIWSGMAMRMDWALFMLTTPVMFFGADLFHRRALKEIWAMWRPKSKVPVLRRFYRFGSMNLLISAGTAVAYFSSLSVLALDAAATGDGKDTHGRNSDTYFDAVIFLTFFILIGRYLEAFSKAKTGDAVALLSDLRPSNAVLLENGTSRLVPVDQLEIGDMVQIPHGQSPPVDGVVEQEGSFLFDESSLTGESRPSKKEAGDKVFTGSVNISNVITIRVTELGGASMLDQIIDVVRGGQAKRAPIERLADVLTGYFTPVITLVAITTWLIWLSLGVSGALPAAWLDVRRGGWAFWSLEFAIAVFVVACPCGIGLAAPTALFVGGGLAAKHSILVQGGGEAFQEASQLTTIVFDKTGTLTEGRMKVMELELLSQEWRGPIVKAMTKVLEDASSHPIARAISGFCSSTDDRVEVTDIREHPGMGMVGTCAIDNKRYRIGVGNERLLSFLGKDPSTEKHEIMAAQDNTFLTTSLQKHQSLGQSTAILAIAPLTHSTTTPTPFTPIGLFAIADPIRPEALSVLASLRTSNLDIHMCTGDNAITARAIASQLNIPLTNVRAGVLPQDKAAYVNELQHPPAFSLSHSSTTTTTKTNPTRKRAIVAFVGDGTNDTPALSVADVSIALSSSHSSGTSTGSDIALSTASFILLSPTLTSLPTLISLSKRVFLRVKINFAWAAIYNICLVPVAAGVFFAIGADEDKGGWRLSPVWASAAMAGSSVSVVLSSLALRVDEITWRRVRERLRGSMR